MSNLHVKKGDAVTIIAGKDKGKTGQIISVDTAKNRVVVDGLNLASHFIKPRNAQEKGGIIEKPAGVDASNVMVYCTTCAKNTKVGFKIETVDGKEVKNRICKKCGASLTVKVSESKAAAKKAAKSEKKATAKKSKATEKADK